MTRVWNCAPACAVHVIVPEAVMACHTPGTKWSWPFQPCMRKAWPAWRNPPSPERPAFRWWPMRLQNLHSQPSTSFTVWSGDAIQDVLGPRLHLEMWLPQYSWDHREVTRSPRDRLKQTQPNPGSLPYECPPAKMQAGDPQIPIQYGPLPLPAPPFWRQQAEALQTTLPPVGKSWGTLLLPGVLSKIPANRTPPLKGQKTLKA